MILYHRFLKFVAVLLLTVLLLCGCAAKSAVISREEAAEQLNTYLHDFVYEPDDAYDCEYIDKQTRDGETVYRFEAFWEEQGERYSLGIFSVFPDGTVMPEEIK